MLPVQTAIAALCLTATCWAQQPEAAATGTVSGRVICADTNMPARLAHVVLQPVIDNSIKAKTGTGERLHQTTIAFVSTLLDGSFIIPDVKPGNYYVFVEKLGYLSPLALISREDLSHPTPPTADLIARLLTTVSVAANRTAVVETRIFKGAAISGTIRFDDGTPNANAAVELLAKDKTGKWASFRTKPIGNYGPSNTDDQGRYRISGIPSGEYLVKTILSLSDITIDRLYGQSNFSQNLSRYSLDIYSGDSLRQRDAKPVKLEEGEEYGTGDITIPISKLHAISGSVVEAGTGQVINSGSVAIVYPDDNTQLVSAKINEEDNAFHFYFVPEGEYTLRVVQAREVSREEVANGPNVTGPTHIVEKKLRDYDAMPQPIIIHGDMTGVIISAQPRSPSNAAPKPQ